MNTTEKTFFGHPRGLLTLFFTEMWERFSFYGMRALLVLYMTNYLFVEAQNGREPWGFSALKGWFEGSYGTLTTQALSSHIYGLYVGLVYFTPFFGGIIADKYIGQKRAVYVGAVTMAIGHFLMAIENLFFPALLFIIIGNGFFKPNISTQVGGLYKQGDARRDRAFTLFYMGINLGAFFSPLVCGTLGQKVGWHWGFGAAGVGMLISLLIYHLGHKDLPDTELKFSTPAAAAEAKKPLTGEEWKRTIGLTFLCMITIFFWGIYEQQGNTLQLWADQKTDWVFFGWEIPSSWYQSFNPMIIFLFAPIMDRVWAWQSRRKSEPGTVIKMALGCLLGTAALLTMFGAAYVIGDGKGSVMWLLGSTFLLTLGELYISPIGLSLVTKVSPTKIVSMMMGVWFLASFAGGHISGIIGSQYESMTKENFFLFLAFLGVVPAVLFIVTNKLLTKSLKQGGEHTHPSAVNMQEA